MRLKKLLGVEAGTKDIERISEAIGSKYEALFQHEQNQYGDVFPPPMEKTIPVMYLECDGTGIPVTPRELAGRHGKQEDGTAKTREAKLGCVFTQTETDPKGRPIRDPNSTSYVGSIEPIELFAKRLDAEAAFNTQGLFIGSGVIEGGCKSIVGKGSNNRACLGRSKAPMRFWRLEMLPTPADLTNCGNGAILCDCFSHLLLCRTPAVARINFLQLFMGEF